MRSLGFVLILAGWLPAAEPYTAWGEPWRLADGAQSVQIRDLRNGVVQPYKVVLSLPLRHGAVYQSFRIWPTKILVARGTPRTCANPCEVAIPLQYGSFRLLTEQFDAAGNLVVRGSPVEIPMAVATESSFTMPLEVIGLPPYSRRVQVQTRNAGGGSLRLWAKTHRIGYPEKARVRINNGAWQNIQRGNVTLLRDARNWTFSTLQFGQSVLEWTMDLPAGSVQGNGANTIEWQFWKEQQEQSGYRVLDFNFLEADLAVSSISVSNGVATVTTQAPHGYQSGEDVLVIDFPGIAWRLNGPKEQITVTGPNSFQFAAPDTPAGSWSYSNVWVARLLIPRSSFVQENPNGWVAPDGADPVAGAAEFNQSDLLSPDALPTQQITATCGDCHARDGRDLKYYGYSPWTSIVRSLLHGKSEQAAKNIAAYVVANPSNIPGRPWNPPFQPGPCADTVDPADWAAGCGLDAVLPYDYGMHTELFGETVETADFDPLLPDTRHWRNQRISFQLPDWNDWLPIIHPKDAYGNPDFQGGFYPYFPTSPLWQNYQTLRSYFTGHCPGPNCAARVSASANNDAIKNAWFLTGQLNSGYRALNGEDPCQGGKSPPDMNCAKALKTLQSRLSMIAYSNSLYAMTKSWELYQEFDLLRHGLSFYPNAGTGRIAFNTTTFNQSPNLSKALGANGTIPGVDDGLVATEKVRSMQWYQLAGILTPQKAVCCPPGYDSIQPLDVGYTQGYFADLYEMGGMRLPLLMTQWVQQNFVRLRNNTPNLNSSSSWRPEMVLPQLLTAANWSQNWRGIPQEDRASYVGQVATAATDKFVSLVCGEQPNGSAAPFTPAQWNIFEQFWDQVNLSLSFEGKLGKMFWHTLKYGKAWGVSQAVRERIAHVCGPALISGRTSTLAQAITESQTSVPLATSNWTSVDHVVLVDSERIRCTGRSGSTLTGCVRGVDGTVAAPHNSGAGARQIIRWVENGLNSNCTLSLSSWSVNSQACDGSGQP